MGNWFRHIKEAQQQLMFYPWDKHPQEVNIQQEGNEGQWTCSECGKRMGEQDIAGWSKGENAVNREFSINYNLTEDQLRQIFQQIITILQPLVDNYKQYENTKKTEWIKNNPGKDIDNFSEYQTKLSWEYQSGPIMQQIAQIPGIDKVFEIYSGFAASRFGWNSINNLIRQLSQQPSEISGQFIDDVIEFSNTSSFVGNTLQYQEQAKKFDVAVTQPYCKECAEKLTKCECCGKPIPPGEDKFETIYAPNSYFCKDCMEDASMCSECGKAMYNDDARVDEQMGDGYCEDCYEKVVKAKNEEQIDWANKQIEKLNLPIGKHLPRNPKILAGVKNFLETYNRKYPNEQFWGRGEIIAKKAGLKPEHIEMLREIIPENDDNVKEALEQINKMEEAQTYMKKLYPNINFQDFPVDMEAEESYFDDQPGFTLIIKPTPKFLEWAETQHPGIKEAWKYMSKSPHHPGSLAYARIAYDGANMVINNLQRDADSDMVKHERPNPQVLAAAKWLDNATKHWNVFLLHVVKSIAMENGLNAYLTTFDQQKRKWGRLPVHKGKQTYREVPEMMGFKPEEHDVDNLIERGVDGQMWNLKPQVEQAVVASSWYKQMKMVNLLPITSELITLLAICP